MNRTGFAFALALILVAGPALTQEGPAHGQHGPAAPSGAQTGGMMGGGMMDESQAEGDKGQGKALYNDNCSSCHGVRGDGNGPEAAGFIPRPVDFTSPGFWQDNVDKKIADATKYGSGQMPAFPELKPDEIKAITQYMSSTFRRSA